MTKKLVISVLMVVAAVHLWTCEAQVVPSRFSPIRQCEPYITPGETVPFSPLECFLNFTLNPETQLFHPDQNKTTVEMVLSYSYNLTVHNITTRDGYMLTLHRITGSPNSPPRPGKKGVLLYHGFSGGSLSWLIQHGNRNLAFKLADAGYEVWLANSRGTNSSRNHTRLNSQSDLSYWDFSIDELGRIDLPDIVNLMLNVTGTDQIHYVCHSMGCGVYLVGLSEVPELNGKISSGILLAPGGFDGHMSGALGTLGTLLQRPLESTISLLLGGRVENDPGDLLRRFGITDENFCVPSALRCGVCYNVLFKLYGYDGPQLNVTNLPNIVAKLADNAALKILYHYFQNMRRCSFRKYDYGAIRNIGIYGSSVPPSYNLTRVTAPTYIFYGESDNAISPLDAARTRDALPPGTVRGFYSVDWEYFNHIDFLMATDADTLVYNRVLEIFRGIDNFRPTTRLVRN